jgi:inosine/xanthosine triphosphate pyrophosphatase family protein
MDNSDNNERIMEDIIARGANTVATYTDEECSQEDRSLNINMIAEGGITADDFANNEEDIATDSKNNEDLEDLMQKVPTRYTYHALTSLVLIQ